MPISLINITYKNADSKYANSEVMDLFRLVPEIPILFNLMTHQTRNTLMVFQLK